MRLKNIEPKVTKILEEYPATRCDDWLLVKVFINEIVDVNSISFASVCEHHNDLGIPSFESITRCRRKVQATREDLVDPTVAAKRTELVEDYKEYAKV